MKLDRPNVLFVFADQWRAQALGHTGDPNVHTPRLDAFAAQSVNFTQAVSGYPVCSPYRASLITGQRPLTHGVFINDRPLEPKSQTMGEAFKAAGYQTGWIGKWHIDGHGRMAFIPPERRRGFDYWRVDECTHHYMDSKYYGDTPETKTWEGYDAEAQTEDAIGFLRGRDPSRPFALFLSWGPPHEPYDTAPQRCKDLYDPSVLAVSPNVPNELQAAARQALQGYYGHCTALDEIFGRLLDLLRELRLDDDTIVVFTSDHGDMIYSHGSFAQKQQPWAESISIPFLIRVPGVAAGKRYDIIDAPDVMPTLLSLCGLPVPSGVEGLDLAQSVRYGDRHQDRATIIGCCYGFYDWTPEKGGREFRGLYTGRYTYVRDHGGPWLLFDNEDDPAQMKNLCRAPKWRTLRKDLDERLTRELAAAGDAFEPGEELMRRWNYQVNQDTGDPPF